MSDRETLEQLLRRRPGLGPKERAAVRRLLEENKQLEKGMDDLRALYRNSGNVGKDMVRVSVSPTEFEELWPAEAAIEIERLLESVDRLQQTWAENKPAAMYKARIDAALAKAEPSLRSVELRLFWWLDNHCREGWGVVREMVEALKGEK